MKRTSLLTCLVATAILAGNVSAQQLVPKWRNAAAGAGTNRDMEYNPATGNLLLVQSGNILRFKSSDGLSAGANVNVSGVSGGSLSLGGIAVTKSGVIYACNYVTSASGPFKIYRWEDEAAAPTIFFSTPSTSFGGAIGAVLQIFESGTNIHFLASGTTTNSLYVGHDGAAWTAKILASDSQAMASSAAFIDFNDNGSGEFRVVAKTGAHYGRLHAFNPTSASPITLTTNRAYLAPLHFAANGIHGIDYDPATGLIGAATRVASTTFVYTNMLIATRGGAGTNILNPVELHRQNLVATAGDAGAVGGVSWGTDGRLYTSSSAAGAGLHAYDVTAFLVSGPGDVTGNVGQSATLSAVVAGSDLTYQWLKGSTPLVDGSKYSGANSASLTINNLAAADADTYTLTVFGVESSSATGSGTLTVNDAPVATTISGIQFVDGAPVISFQGAGNRTHVIEATSTLPGTWQGIGSVTAPDNGQFEFKDESATGNDTRFYRAVTE